MFAPLTGALWEPLFPVLSQSQSSVSGRLRPIQGKTLRFFSPAFQALVTWAMTVAGAADGIQ